jgi:acetolactate synthase-1/2/3 large subunit
MNGAESLVHTLVDGGIDVSFTNPGTSEMHFVAALDKIAGMRCVLCLFEGVVSGAADGYARMSGKPAATLLHLGAGFGNAVANMHNARKAQSPVVNIVGDHATYHVQYETPLKSDVAAIAAPVSDWVRTSPDSTVIGADGAAAIAAARTVPGQVATLILPADTAWGDGGAVGRVPEIAGPETVGEDAVAQAVAALEGDGPNLLLLGGMAVFEEPLAVAGRIAARTGCDVMAEGFNARMERGAGRFPVRRVPYAVDAALARLEGYRNVVLAGARTPIAFFAYPGKPSELLPEGCHTVTLARRDQDQAGALAALAEAVGAGHNTPVALQADDRPAAPTGAITPEAVAAAIGAMLVEDAIVIDESITTGRGLEPITAGAPRHDWMQITGGSIGIGMPLATGAAIACPDRKVVCLEADGSAMYTLQALWTQAREGLDVTTLLFANGTYNILKHELANVGAGEPGPRALDMLSLDNPKLGWTGLAGSMGVEAERVETAEDLCRAMARGQAAEGPYLIEVAL